MCHFCIYSSFIIWFSVLLHSQFKFYPNTPAKSLFPVWQTQWAYIKAVGTELWIIIMLCGMQNKKKKGLWISVICCAMLPSVFLKHPPPPVGQGLLIIEVSLSHSDAQHSAGLLWTSDRPVTQNSTWQHTTLTTDRRPCPPGGIRTRSSSKRAAADPQLRPRGHWDRRTVP